MVYLTRLSVVQILWGRIVEWVVNMNWNGCGRKRSWPNLKYYTVTCLEGLRKTLENLRMIGVPDPGTAARMQVTNVTT
jgi:hypothetical protein